MAVAECKLLVRLVDVRNSQAAGIRYILDGSADQKEAVTKENRVLCSFHERGQNVQCPCQETRPVFSFTDGRLEINAEAYQICQARSFVSSPER